MTHGDSDLRDRIADLREVITLKEEAVERLSEQLAKERERTERVRAERNDLDRQLGEARNAAIEYCASEGEQRQRAEQAEAAVQRARDLHVPHSCDDCSCRRCWGVGTVCRQCGEPWPCTTHRAIDHPEETHG